MAVKGNKTSRSPRPGCKLLLQSLKRSLLVLGDARAAPRPLAERGTPRGLDLEVRPRHPGAAVPLEAGPCHRQLPD